MFEKVKISPNLNVYVYVMVAAACLTCLWIASQPFPLLLRILAAIVFSFTNNTMFSLMHEAVHGNFHVNRKINEIGGRAAAAFFPTAFSLQRAFHLTHHRNNRSDAERFDYVGSHENHFLKTAQWYSILTGLYWFSAPAFCAVYAVFSEIIPWQRLFASGSRFAKQTSAAPFLECIAEVPISRVRFDVLTTIAIQLVIIELLGLSFYGWFLCYAFFAVNWSSLQYADHAFSNLDRYEGAWNLKVNPFVRVLFLNYHYHLVHHRDPNTKWAELPDQVQETDKSISFGRILLLMWEGPRPLTDQNISQPVLERQQLVTNLMLSCIFAALFAIFYTTASSIFLNSNVHHDLTTSIDTHVPFLPMFAVLYVTIGLFLAIAPFAMKTPAHLLPFGIALVFELMVAWFIFYVFPVAAPEVVYDHTGFVGWFMVLADKMNLEGNLFPSLHVALATSAAWVYFEFLPRKLAIFTGLWASLIVASTVFTRQHYFLDMVGGMLLAITAMLIVRPWAIRQLAQIKDEVLKPI
jgi:fatty acid desaturase/membrane-associated phospholipid phosphatase